MNDITVQAVGSQSFKSGYYDPIIEPTGGNYYNIYGNFRDIMLDISRMNSSSKYMITYQSPGSGQALNHAELKLRFAGLGGSAVFDYTNTSQKISGNVLSFYPNPFNPEISFQVNRKNFSEGKLRIYNVLGQFIREFTVAPGNSGRITWDARNYRGGAVSAGFYIARLILKDGSGKVYTENAKILYLK